MSARSRGHRFSVRAGGCARARAGGSRPPAGSEAHAEGAPAPEATLARFAIVIGNNRAEAADTPSLRYADDDAVATHELLVEAGVDSRLLARLDPDSQRLHPGLTPAGLPRAADLDSAMATLSERMRARAAARRGRRADDLLQRARRRRSRRRLRGARGPPPDAHHALRAAGALAGGAQPRVHRRVQVVLPGVRPGPGRPARTLRRCVRRRGRARAARQHRVRPVDIVGARQPRMGATAGRHPQLRSALGVARRRRHRRRRARDLRRARRLPHQRQPGDQQRALSPRIHGAPAGQGPASRGAALGNARGGVRPRRGRQHRPFLRRDRARRAAARRPPGRATGAASCTCPPSARCSCAETTNRRRRSSSSAPCHRSSALAPARPEIARRGALHLAFEQLFAATFERGDVGSYERRSSSRDLAAVAAPPPFDAAPEEGARTLRRRIALAAGAVAIAGVAAGLVTGALALQRYERGAGASQADIARLNRSIERLDIASIACFAAAGAAGLTWAGARWLGGGTSASVAPAPDGGVMIGLARKY